MTRRLKRDDSQLTAAERIAEATGEPVEKYSAEEYELPPLENLEIDDAEEYYDD